MIQDLLNKRYGEYAEESSLTASFSVMKESIPTTFKYITSRSY
jgi:hypothetical protein